MIGEALRSYTQLYTHMESLITPEASFTAFKRLADTYAPTLSARYTPVSYTHLTLPTKA